MGRVRRTLLCRAPPSHPNAFASPNLTTCRLAAGGVHAVCSGGSKGCNCCWLREVCLPLWDDLWMICDGNGACKELKRGSSRISTNH